MRKHISTVVSRLILIASCVMPMVALAIDWTTGGNASWYVESTSGGIQTFRSGAISNNRSTWMQVAVEGPGVVSFQWKVSSEQNCDKLNCAVDGGTPQFSISGTKDWTDVTIEIASGAHTVKWTYSKDSSCSSGSDCGWVRNIVLPEPYVFITYDKPDGTVTVAGAKPSPTGSMSIPSTIGGKRVSSISGSAFNNCTRLTAVTIPDGVTDIGESAFQYCSSMKSVTIPSSVTNIGSWAFHGCTALTSASIPEGVTSVGNGTFCLCSGLTSVTLAESVRSIGTDAFRGCTLLQSVTIPSCVTDIGASAFEGCSGLKNITIPSGVTNVGNGAFYNCSGLTSLTIQEGITQIAAGAFSGCSGLTSVTIPSGVTVIGRNAFSRCSRLTTVSLPPSVTSIGGYAFEKCSRLAEVTIPSSVKDIGEYAFSGCIALSSIDIPSSVASVGDEAFAGCTGLKSVSMHEGVASIGRYAFGACSGMTSVAFPASVTNIGDSAFSGCTGLRSVPIPESATRIGSEAFSGCTGLTSVTIPSSVTSIGSRAFEGCTGLVSVTIPDHLAGYALLKGCIGLQDANGFIILNDRLFGYGGTATAVVIPSTVREICEGAFSGCSKITSVTVPPSVTKMGHSAFGGCSGLTEVHVSDLSAWCGIEFEFIYTSSYAVPDSNPLNFAHRLFLGDNEVTNLDIPEGVTSVGSNAFYNCTGLKSVTIPSSVTNIGSKAFYQCSGMTDVTLLSGEMTVGKDAFGSCSGLEKVHVSDLADWCRISFDGGYANPLYYAHHLFLGRDEVLDMVIPIGVTEIKKDAFSYCSGLKSVTIPSSVTNIGYDAFWYCKGLTCVTIAEGVKHIRQGAFESCSSLKEVHISDVTAWCGIEFAESYANPLEIARHLFLDQEEILDLVIPEGTPRIGNRAFEGCSALTSVTIPSSVLSIGAEAFCKCNGLKDVTIAPGVTSVGSAAFCECYGLEDLTIPIGVTNIGSLAFYYCSGLTNVVIPAGVTDIGRSAFQECGATMSLTIPASVKHIGERAFWACYGLQELTFEGDAPSVDGNSLGVMKTGQQVRVHSGTAGWDDDGDGKWLGLEIVYLPRSFYSITYENTRGLANANPSEYKPTEAIVFAALSDVADARFVGWEPARIDIGSSGDLVVTAVWETKELGDLLAHCSNALEGGDTGWRTEWTGSSWVMRSGVIGDRQQSTLSCSVGGAGVLTFKWKVSSECAAGYKDDYLSFEIDGTEVAWIGGEQGWLEKRFELASGVQHTLKWTYLKDKSGKAGDDCGWLKDVVWTSADPIPQLGDEATPQDVAAALDGSVDTRLKERITNAANYNAYRDWATSVKTPDGSDKAGAQAVKESNCAWLSFAVGSDKLISGLPTAEDVKVEVFKPSAESGKFDFTVSVEGLTVSEEALKENLKQVFGLEGGASLEELSEGNVDIIFGTPVDGKVKFSAGPNAKNAEAKTFFMKVKMTP